MKNIIKDLFYHYYFSDKQNSEYLSIEEDLKELKASKKLLKKHLSQKQKKQLLRIIDAEERIIEKRNLDSFTVGFKAGLRVGYESK